MECRKGSSDAGVVGRTAGGAMGRSGAGVDGRVRHRTASVVLAQRRLAGVAETNGADSDGVAEADHMKTAADADDAHDAVDSDADAATK